LCPPIATVKIRLPEIGVGQALATEPSLLVCCKR
jgi:hypothetical protein